MRAPGRSHTCASLLIAAGAHPKAIQERLGHSTITMTLDRYGHLLPGLGDALAGALDEACATACMPGNPLPRIGSAQNRA